MSAGLTLGGGSGWLDRKFGLACDNLLSVELVTADGRTVTASEDENPELFWALHGGGGNFGVATVVHVPAHPLPAFATWRCCCSARRRARGRARLPRLHRGRRPDEVGGGLIYITGPPEEFVPEHLQSAAHAAACCVTYAGGEAEARERSRPLLELGPTGEMIAAMPYAELQCMLDDPPGFRNYWSAEYLDELPDEAVDRFCARAADMIVPSPSQHVLFPQGGAVRAAPSD